LKDWAAIARPLSLRSRVWLRGRFKHRSRQCCDFCVE
jgi:hypothetical protein